MNAKSTRLAALRAAFPYTVPIFAGFWFVGVAYGVYMNASGFSFWYPLFMSALIFGGSLEFIAVALLLSPFCPDADVPPRAHGTSAPYILRALHV